MDDTLDFIDRFNSWDFHWRDVLLLLSLDKVLLFWEAMGFRVTSLEREAIQKISRKSFKQYKIAHRKGMDQMQKDVVNQYFERIKERLGKEVYDDLVNWCRPDDLEEIPWTNFLWSIIQSPKKYSVKYNLDRAIIEKIEPVYEEAIEISSDKVNQRIEEAEKKEETDWDKQVIDMESAEIYAGSAIKKERIQPLLKVACIASHSHFRECWRRLNEHLSNDEMERLKFAFKMQRKDINKNLEGYNPALELKKINKLLLEKEKE